MAQTLAMVAQQNNIDAFYGLLAQNPYILDQIDAIPFVQTPLHIAASVGSTQFAIEILRLKPSFGKKLNPDGFSALDLALRGGHTQTVRGLIKQDPQLIRVKGRNGGTPLHCAAEVDDTADLLAEFLYICPKSIEDLTNDGETAVHIAVKQSNLRGLKVLLGWMKETGNKHISGWEDENGNTVLHLAASIKDNIEAVRLIIYQWPRSINCRNVEGLTALDIALGHPNAEENGSIATALRSAGAKSSSSSHSRTINLADYCSSILERSFLGTLRGKYSMQVREPNLSTPRIIFLSSERRNAMMVVLVLITTVTFQATINPPRGPISQTTDISNGPTSNSINAGHGNPHAAPAPMPLSPKKPENKNLVAVPAKMENFTLCLFLMLNSGLFLISILVIFFLLQTNDKWDLSLRVVLLVYFALCYAVSVTITSPSWIVIVAIAALLLEILFLICWEWLVSPKKLCVMHF